MKLSFVHNNQTITYCVTYKHVKKMSIHVSETGQVDVIAPIGTPVYKMMNQVKQKGDWIIAKLNELTKKEEPVKLLDAYTYAGKSYKLNVTVKPELDTIKVKMLKGKLNVETPTDTAEEIRQAVIAWYENKVENKMKDCLKHYESHFDIMPQFISIIDSDEIIFQANENQFLAHAKLGILPKNVLDYILVKSLCYLNTTDEEKSQQKLLSILPDYEKSQHWLDEHKNKLVL